MNTPATDKEILTLEETRTMYCLSPRKFADLIHKGPNTFSVKYFGSRTLILRPQFEEYLARHPEIRRRGYEKR